jgi:hypothetical protein
VAARYDIVTAGENRVTVVASGVAAGLAGSRKTRRSRSTRAGMNGGLQLANPAYGPTTVAWELRRGLPSSSPRI